MSTATASQDFAPLSSHMLCRRRCRQTERWWEQVQLRCPIRALDAVPHGGIGRRRVSLSSMSLSPLFLMGICVCTHRTQGGGEVHTTVYIAVAAAGSMGRWAATDTAMATTAVSTTATTKTTARQSNSTHVALLLMLSTRRRRHWRFYGG